MTDFDEAGGAAFGQIFEVIIGRRLHETHTSKSIIWFPTKDLF
jgi:hypothetical protein